MGSRSLNFYIGLTRDLHRRVRQRKNGEIDESFTSRYNINRLLYFEKRQTFAPAEARETQLKAWSRKKKLALLRAMNPNLEDLAADWCTNADPSTRRLKAAARSG
jgi:putative endonuclease